MGILRIKGGTALSGEVTVQGAKNSVLPILAASLISGGVTELHNCPELSDVDAAISILRHLGCTVERRGGTVTVDSASVTRCDIPDTLMRKMRSSVIFLGAILARCGQAVLSMPGGCELGPRPIDLHLDAMRSLGAEITERGGDLIFTSKRLTGCRVDLTFPSVGATENTMLAAAGAKGETLITNAAREPEIRDLGEYLTALGVRVRGAGTSTVTVEGGEFSTYAVHRVMPDRIAAATYIACACAAGGELELTGLSLKDLEPVDRVFLKMGAELTERPNSVLVRAGERLVAPPTVVTRPYPGFPTDAQPPLMAACLRAQGVSCFVETIFENRYRHVPELLRMGADIRVDGRVAIVRGGAELHGAYVRATDLRGGAAMIVAALGAQGETEIGEIGHILRGYERIADRLRQMGADAEIIDRKEEQHGKSEREL